MPRQRSALRCAVLPVDVAEEDGVRVGAAQTLEFVEADEVAAYDGHHIAFYAARKSTPSRRWRGGLTNDFHAGYTSTEPRSCAATRR